MGETEARCWRCGARGRLHSRLGVCVSCFRRGHVADFRRVSGWDLDDADGGPIIPPDEVDETWDTVWWHEDDR